MAIAALGFIVLLIIVAIAAPLIVEVFGAPPPDQQSTAALDDFGSPTGPSSEHLFGVDHLGRDVFARIIYGARVSLEVAIVATGIAVVIGVVLGAGRRLLPRVGRHAHLSLDGRPARVPDPAAGHRPRLGVLARRRAAWAASSSPGLTVVIFVIALVTWPYIARIIRGQVLSLREKEFVEASRSLGASSTRIMFREVLPNLVAPIIVYATLIIPTNILFEAALSFLGVGVQPPTASWGAMIADATAIFDTAWWYMFFPGLALVLTVLAFNLVGDGLQDALNPKTGRQ